MDLHTFLAFYSNQHQPKSYLEIGTREGDSLKRVIQNSKLLEDIYICDTWGGQYGGTARYTNHHIESMIKNLDYKGNITYLNGDSKQKIPELGDNCKSFFDLILVDGDHSAEGAMTDLDNVLPLSKSPGGCILFHDITHHAHLYLEKVFDDFITKNSIPNNRTKKIKYELGIGIIYT